VDRTINTNLKLVNEYPISTWINLQDWSTCTLACGGGSQTLHRFCLRPQNAPPCDGESIITRLCNTKPCPQEHPIKVDVLPTQIKIVQVSLKPQRFVKCEIKEEDMDIIRDDMGDMKDPPRIPSRVKMNKSSIVIYDPGMDEKIFKSFNIKEASFKVWEKDKKCIKIEDCKTSAIMCLMCNNNSTIEAWMKDYTDFRENCQNDEFVPTVKTDDPRLKDIRTHLEQVDLMKHIDDVRKKQKVKKELEDIQTLKKAQILAIKVNQINTDIRQRNKI
jgi:hypothetical protein